MASTPIGNPSQPLAIRLLESDGDYSNLPKSGSQASLPSSGTQSSSTKSLVSDIPHLVKQDSFLSVDGSFFLGGQSPEKKGKLKPNSSMGSVVSTTSTSHVVFNSKQEGLLGGRLQDRSYNSQCFAESCIKQWRGRVIAAGCGTISFTFLILNLSMITNAIAATLTGGFLQGVVSSGFSNATTARIRQVVMTIFGQITFFYLSQFFANDMDEEVRNTLIYILLGMWGVNLGSVGGWVWNERQINAESNLSSLTREIRLGQICNRKIFTGYALKLVGSAAAVSQFFSHPDERVKAISLFLSAFLATQTVTMLGMRFLNRKIEKHDMNRSSDLFQVNETWLRSCKKIVMTASYLGLPFCFPSYTIDNRILELGISGLLLGLFDGILYQAQKDRINNISFKDLKEFKEIRQLSTAEDTHLNKIVRQITKIAYPLYAFSGVLGFSIWQEITLNDDKDRVAIGAMLGGFLSTFALTQTLDYFWDPDKKKKFQDNLVKYFFMAPRVLGIRPFYLYLAIIKVLKMDSEEIRSDDTFNFLLTTIGWWAYGTEMWVEYRATSSEKVGSPLTRIPLMIFANGASMFEAFMRRAMS